MKIYAQEMIKRHIQFYLFLGLSFLILVTIIINLKAISKSNKPYLIAIDSNGTRIVQDLTDPIYKTEALTFIQKFLANVYNFNHENFMKRIGPATSMMSEALWKQKRDQILSLKSKVESEEISLTSQITKITKGENEIYHALIDSTEKSRLNTHIRKIKVSLKLVKTKRTHENPTGLEVDSYEETLLP